MERFERQISLVDIFMVALALLSLGILIYEDLVPLTPDQRQRLLLVDLVIVAIFAVEFGIRVWQAEQKWKFVRGHWYELVGLVPVAAFRAFRLLRLVRLVVIAGRFFRVTDKTLGEGILQGQIKKYRNIIVEEITDPVVVAILGIAERSLTKGNFGTAIARGLEKNRDTLVDHIVEQMRADKTLNLVLKTPGVGSAIERLPGKTIDGVIQTLGSKEVDETIRGVIQEIFSDLRKEIGTREWRRASSAEPS